MTECNRNPIQFSRVRGRDLVADFSGGTITSDAGVLLLREADRRIGLLAALDAAIPDPRNPALITHPQRAMLAQRVFGLALGYEALNDHQRLREDPVWQAATDHPGRDDDPALASPPTLCRLENRVTRASPVRMAAVLVDQFIDRTFAREKSFFGPGCVAHVSMADPVSPALVEEIEKAARGAKISYTRGGTYLVMEGPQFSTRAESNLYRSWGCDVIGMTNMPEAKLAREAEICYATVAMVTDYDCWHEEEAAVTVEALLANLRANSELAGHALHDAITALPATRSACACGQALAGALLTPRESIPPDTRKRLAVLLREP